MELVYLWVEDYKNIQKQGFNFSPRFDCKYENNELTIKENDDYIENFFGDNINVTAIVGKNGSGKSNILEALIQLYLKNSYNKQNNFIYAIYFHDSKYYISSTDNESLNINNNIHELEDNKTFLIYYDYSLSTIIFDYDEVDKDIIDNSHFYKIKKEQYYPIIMQPSKSNRFISIEDIDRETMKYMLEFSINNSIDFSHINDFFQEISFKLSFEYRIISGDDSLYDDDNPIYKKIDDFYRPDNFLSEFNRDELINLTILYILQKTFTKTREIDSSFKISEEFEKQWYKKDDFTTSFDKYNIDKLMEYIKSHNYKNLYLNYGLEIEKSFKFIEFLKKQKKNFYIDNQLYNINENKKLLACVPTWINIELIDKEEISFYNLSYGEKFLIKFIYNLLYQINILNKFHLYENITLSLDEVEQGLHPEWQKKFLSLLIKVLKTQKKFNFNIVCTTHSPFILSDIPKENIYFMKNGKNDYVFKKQTFGANIHTLLSDSFFMEDGLMGEFAKNKINTIMRFLSGKNSFIDFPIENIKKVIETIGEPFLKDKLLFMYNEKYPKSDTEKILELEKQIESIKNGQDKV